MQILKPARLPAFWSALWRIGCVGVLAGMLLPGAQSAESKADLVEQALAPRSGPRGQTMFRVMPPAETGIVTDNRYADPAMWASRHRELELGAVGTGVAIGDYDGDERADLFVVSKTESCRLFRNLGQWKFEDVTEKAGVADHGEAAGIWKQGATFADVNNDGRLDLYVCRFGAPNLLYLNQGDGTFKEEAAARGLAVNDSSVMAAFCDYDRDGWLDVHVQTNLLDITTHPKGQRDYLFRNNGAGTGPGRGGGTFTDVTARAGLAGETQGHSATWWDYDHDGWPDLYVANDFMPPDNLYRNNRDGTFTNVIDQAVPHTTRSSMGSDLGDINNDGLIDLFVADMAATTHQKDQRTMAPFRGNAIDPSGPSAATALQYNRNALYLATGTGRCLEAAFLTGLSATDWTWATRFEDLDNDGRLDLFVTNGMFREPHNADLLVRMSAAQNQAEEIRIEKSSPIFNEANLAFRNQGDLRFEDASAAWGLNEFGVSFGAALGDLDGDGDLDLVYTNYQKGVTVLRNDSDQGHRVIFALRGLSTPLKAMSPSTGPRSNRFGVGATVHLETASGRQVRQLVLARGVLSNSEPTLHFGLGEDTQILRATIDWPSGQQQIFNDLAVDRKYTVTEQAGDLTVGAALRRDSNEASRRKAAPTVQTAGQFSEASRTTNFSFIARESAADELAQQPLLPQRQNRRGPAIAVGDVGGRGRDDAIIGGTPHDPARLLLADGAAHFVPAEMPGLESNAPLNDGPLLVFDADGDGANDLLLTKGGSNPSAGLPEYQPRLLLNDGHGRFRPASPGALPLWPQSAGALTAADFNRDGRLDIFIGSRLVPGEYPATPRSGLWANRGARFDDVTDALAPGLREVGMVTSALWSDVDNDGWPDLLVAVEWGPVKYFHNNQGKGFEDWTERAGFASAGTGWWSALATADFNGDGRPDYVAGNVGLNTPYRADAAHPALLFSGDFKGDGSNQLFEAYHEGERLYPRRTRRDLGAAIPSILKRYPRNDFYARATLEEIIGAEKLATAQRFAATELRSGVFLSQPGTAEGGNAGGTEGSNAGGTYHFEPLPRLAQIAPVQGLVAGDFDGDGCADIYAVQNSYAPIPSVGRFDGGVSQLLRGDGRGHFTPVQLAESNLLVTGDAKALAVLDLDQDGWPDFLVTRNNDRSLAFRNEGVPGRHSLAVRLRGRVGNPTAVGARLSLILADGSAQTAEISAGAGYYSQSSPACYFGWSDANPPKQIDIRWPDGRSTRHEVPAGATTLLLAIPGT